MENKELRNKIVEKFEGCNIRIFSNPSFDNSIIGVSTDGRTVYDLGKMIEEYMSDNNCSYEEAVEFIEYNTIRSAAYYSDAPVIIRSTIENILD